MENAIKIESGSSFFLNASICGFLTFLEKNFADEGTDYEIKDQCLYINIDYLTSNNIPEMYVKTIVEYFEPDTKFFKQTVNDKRFIDSLKEIGFDAIGDDKLKSLKKKFDDFYTMITKKSFCTVYNALEYADILDKAEDFKQCNDLNAKYDKYVCIINILNQVELKENLIFTELSYTKFADFFTYNKATIMSLSREKNCYELYNNKFFAPLMNSFNVPKKKKVDCCIECRTMFKKDTKLSKITFAADTADDVDRKTSRYWNHKSDAYICPICKFIYSFVPLGVVYMKSEAIFINNNSSIRDLQRVMTTCKAKAENENSSARHHILRTLTSEKIDALDNITSNIQVIIRSPDYSHFKFEVIDKDMVMKLQKGKQYLSYLENKWISFDGKNINSVYDLVLDCIYERQNLYYFLDKLLRVEISNSRNINYLKGLLRLAIIFNGGVEMDKLNKKVDLAFFAGNNLRKVILGKDADKNGSEDDNRLRGFVYRLVNLSSVGDREQFMDTIMRVYSGFNLTMPSIFKDCYVSDEMFKAIAHGFILGLKYVPYKKDNKEDVNNG